MTLVLTRDGGDGLCVGSLRSLALTYIGEVFFRKLRIKNEMSAILIIEK